MNRPAIDPSSYHSSAPFNIGNGKFLEKGRARSYSEIFGRTRAAADREDRRVIALTAAMPEGTGLDVVQTEFPGKFLRRRHRRAVHVRFRRQAWPWAASSRWSAVYSTFMQRAVDQIIHDVSLMGIPMLVGLDRAGLVGGDGPTHQGIYDIALLRPVPGIVLMAPKDENELQHMIYTGMPTGSTGVHPLPQGTGTGCAAGRGISRDPRWPRRKSCAAAPGR